MHRNRPTPQWLVFLAWATAIAAVFPQEAAKPERPETYRVKSQLVRVFLTVSEGTKRVKGLTASDFALREDGQRQSIDRLDSGEVPLQIALLLDTSSSMRTALKETQEAAILFVQSLRPVDRITLIPFNSRINAISQTGDDRAGIIEAIRGTRAANRTKLYDAILYAMKILDNMEGRKAIVVFSDGEDTESTSSLTVAANTASRNGCPIFTVSAGPVIDKESYRAILQRLADVNGGKAFFVQNAQKLRAAFLKVSEELRDAYVLYYYTRLVPDERWHELTVSARNPAHRVYARKGFYLGRPTVTAAPPQRVPGVDFDPPVDPAAVEKSATTALAEVIQSSALPKNVGNLASAEGIRTPAARKQSAPTFKVETRLVEVPVLVEPPNQSLSQSDFQVQEDGKARKIVEFQSGIRIEDLGKIRKAALEQAEKSAGKVKPELNAGSREDLISSRCYLVIDNLTMNPVSFLTAKKIAEELARRYHSPTRPFSVYFTGQSSAGPQSEDVEQIVAEIRKGTVQSPGTNPENEVITAYQATLIERGESEAKELGELQVASRLGLKYINRLGELEGYCMIMPLGTACDYRTNIPSVQSNVRARVLEVLAHNSLAVRRTIEGLSQVLRLALAGRGNYPKTVIFISSGFILGRGSRGDASPLLQSLVATARQQDISIHTIEISDPGGQSSNVSLGLGTLGQAPVMETRVANALSSAGRLEKVFPLETLAAGTGGKHFKSNLAESELGAMVSTPGSLYYLAFLSQQPTDGRFHKISVLVPGRSVRVHARQGYYARPAGSADEEGATVQQDDLVALLARVAETIRSGDHAGTVQILEPLTRRIPSRADLWYHLGAAYLNLKEPAKAVEAFQRALAQAPEDRAAALMLSRSFVAAGNIDAGIEVVETFWRRNPGDLELLIQLGRLYEAASQLARAYALYRSGLDFTAHPPQELYVALIRSAALMGRSTEARVLLEQYQASGGDENKIRQSKALLDKKSP